MVELGAIQLFNVLGLRSYKGSFMRCLLSSLAMVKLALKAAADWGIMV